MTLVLSRSHTYDEIIKDDVRRLSKDRIGNLVLINLFIKAGHGRTSAYDTALRILEDDPGAVIVLYKKELRIPFDTEVDAHEEEKFMRLLKGKRVGYVNDPTPANIIQMHDALCKIT